MPVALSIMLYHFNLVALQYRQVDKLSGLRAAAMFNNK